MRVTLFGATGRTGRVLISVLRERGHAVRAVCRREGALASELPGLEVVVADLSSPESLARAIEGSDAVICAFGPTSAKEAPFCAALTRHIVEAMGRLGVRRLLCITGAMVGDYAGRSVFFQGMADLFRRQAPAQAADRAEQERLVRESGLEWTVVKPPRLTEAAPRGKVRAGESEPVGMLSRLPRADLARFLADQLERGHFVRKSVVVRA
jgi:putative NADH-flavin reductase